MTTQTLNASAAARPSMIKRVLRGNAIFSEISGVVMIAGSRWLPDFTGIPSSLAFTLLGVALFGWAVYLWLNTREEPIHRQVALTAMFGDIGWVLATIVALVAGLLPLTAAGVWLFAIVADIVAVFAVLEYIGLRRMNS